MLQNLEIGLKRIVNVIFWLWISIGVFLLFFALVNYRWNFSFIWLLIIGFLIPYLLKIILFYVIDGFTKKY